MFLQYESYIHVSSNRQKLTCLYSRLKEFVKEQLVAIPATPRAAPPTVPVPPQSTSPVAALTDPGAILAGLLWIRCSWCVEMISVNIHVQLIYSQALIHLIERRGDIKTLSCWGWRKWGWAIVISCIFAYKQGRGGVRDRDSFTISRCFGEISFSLVFPLLILFYHFFFSM